MQKGTHKGFLFLVIGNFSAFFKKTSSSDFHKAFLSAFHMGYKHFLIPYDYNLKCRFV